MTRTYSGATTGDILRPSAAGQPAQLEAVTPDTRLVTITAGPPGRSAG